MIEFHIRDTVTPPRPLLVRANAITALCGRPNEPTWLYLLGCREPFILKETTDEARRLWEYDLSMERMEGFI